MSTPHGELSAAGAHPTEPFRREHAEIRKHLDHLDGKVGALVSAAAPERVSTMAFVVRFLREHIMTHAAWEERVLYPVIDRCAGSGPHPFTASMRREHRVIERWIDELATERAKAAPDATAFARRTDNLLGLIRAHLEEEEDVALPILDATMTPEDFAREILSAGGHHGAAAA
jgi:hemerythrin-like domain-containing protein